MQGGVWKSRSLAATQRRCAVTRLLPPPSTGNVTSDFRGQAGHTRPDPQLPFPTEIPSRGFGFEMDLIYVTKWKIRLLEVEADHCRVTVSSQNVRIGFQLLIFENTKNFEIFMSQLMGILKLDSWKE